MLAALVFTGCRGAEPVRPPAPLRVSVAGPGLLPEVATGFAVGRGRVLTVAHVLDGGGAVRVAGRPARVVRADAQLDLAVLSVPGLSGEPVRLGTHTGDGAIEVLRDGRPRALAAQIRRRVTATVKGPEATSIRPALEVDAAIQPGDSGASVTDPAGHVLGIVFAAGAAGSAWAVDASAARAILAAPANH